MLIPRRLWLVQELRKIGDHCANLVQCMALRAEAEIEHLMPGYTHLQVRNIQLDRRTADLTSSRKRSPFAGLTGCAAMHLHFDRIWSG